MPPVFRYVPITGFEDALEFLPRLLDGSLRSHVHVHAAAGAVALAS